MSAPQERPQNCGTGHCSCVECVMEPSPPDQTDSMGIPLSCGKPACSPEQEPTKLWCETCEGTGEVYQEHQAGCHVGGHLKCPDCDAELAQRKKLRDAFDQALTSLYALATKQN